MAEEDKRPSFRPIPKPVLDVKASRSGEVSISYDTNGFPGIHIEAKEQGDWMQVYSDMGTLNEGEVVPKSDRVIDHRPALHPGAVVTYRARYVYDNGRQIGPWSDEVSLTL